jgi:hypothetical protein
MSRDDWDADSRRWGYYEDDEAEEEASPVVAGGQVGPTSYQQSSPDVVEPEAHDPADRLARRAGHVLAGLVAQSAGYGEIDWAVGAYLDGSGESNVWATSNEGFGFLPPGLRWPPDVKSVFGFRDPMGQGVLWQGLANPARVVADHFTQAKASGRDGVRLVAILGSRPLGSAVTAWATQQGAAITPASPATGSAGAGQGRSRLEAASTDLATLVRAVRPDRRQAVASWLMHSAVEASGISAVSPSVLLIAQQVWGGDATGEDVAQVRHVRGQLSARACAERIDDERLGPVREPGSWQEQEEYDVCPEENGVAYSVPFKQARACSVIERLASCWTDGRDLDAEELLEIAYEHLCVVEDSEKTARVVREHQ